MEYLCLDLAMSRSAYSDASQLPAKSASTYTSRPFYFTGLMIVPLSLVPFKYLAIHPIAFVCYFLVNVYNIAHWWVMYASVNPFTYS